MRHVREHHENRIQAECPRCSRSFTRHAHLKLHMKTCKGEQPSSSCSPSTSSSKRKQPSSITLLKKPKTSHIPNHHVICSICNAGFSSKKLRDEHVSSVHSITPIDIYHQYIPSHVSADDDTMQCIENSIHLIMRPHQFNSDINQLNFYRFTQLTLEDIQAQLEEVFRINEEAFKLNISFGFIMTNFETGEHQYFYPAQNQTLLNEPYRFSKSSDIYNFIETLKDKDILEHAHQQRPNTKWRLTHITNVLYITYNLRYVIGSEVNLPPHLLKKKSINCLLYNNQLQTPYNDNLCIFRCLMLHKHKQKRDNEKEVRRAFELWTDGKVQKSDFKGVKMNEIPKFEKLFEINVNIYSLSEDDKATILYKSSGLYDDTLFLDKYLNHVSYINNFKAYASKFSCRKCNRYFNRVDNCVRHELICDDSARLKYPGGFYSAKKNVFEQLADIGIDVMESDRYHNDFAVYDFESMLIPNNQSAGPNTSILSDHQPISVSVCSTVNPKPDCHVSEKSEELVTFMMDYFNRIQQRVATSMKLKFKSVFDVLEEYKSITQVIMS